MAFDTTPEARDEQRAAWRRLGAIGRVRATVELSEATRRLTLDGIGRRHPELDDAARLRAFIALVHGVDPDISR